MNATSTPSRRFSPLSVLKFTGIATGIVGLTFLMLQLLNVALFWAFYSSIFEKVQKLGGFEDSITGIITIFVLSAAMFVAPLTISAFFTGDRKKLLIVAGIASLWFLGTFILSRPRDGEYFNKLTGSPQYKYCIGVDGQISLHNIGYNFDPRTGQKLQLFTAEVARKYPQIVQPKRVSPPKPVVTPVENPRPAPIVIASLPPTPTPAAEPTVAPPAPTQPVAPALILTETPAATRGIDITEGLISASTQAPTPRAKSLMEIAQNAPICDDAVDIKLDLKFSPRKDVPLQIGCWSGWVEFDLSTIILFSRMNNTNQSRYGVVGEKNLLYLLPDGRILTAEKLKTTKLTISKYRLIGEGVARAAIGRSEKEFKEIIETSLRERND